MQPNTVHPRELARFASDSGGKKTPNAGRHFTQTPPTSGCYFQVKRDERIIIQLSFIYTQMHITFTHNYTHSRTHTLVRQRAVMDKTNVPEGSYTRQGIPLADHTFPKTRCPSSVGGCTDREGISHFQYGHRGLYFTPVHYTHRT